MNDDQPQDPISQALGLTPIVKTASEVTVYAPEVESVDGEELQADLESARENLNSLIEQGKEAVEELLKVAKQSQHPRAFEVIATLLKTNADLNKDLVGLHKSKKELKADDPASKNPALAPGTVNNNLFVGSTADFQKFVEEMRNGKK